MELCAMKETTSSPLRPTRTCRRSQWLSISEAVAVPEERRRSSSAKPNDASAGMYACTVKRSEPSRISSRRMRARRRPSTAYTADRPSELVVTCRRGPVGEGKVRGHRHPNH